MLASIEGQVQRLHATKKYLVVVANQLGYKVFVPNAILTQLKPGETVLLHLYQVVHEDANDLYGFLTAVDLDLFEQLISVSGVGPKVGLALLSDLSAAAIVQAIAQGDHTLLTQVSGVGKKIAERLIMELKTLAVLPVDSGSSQTMVEALQQLGYSPAEIRSVLQQLDRSLNLEQQLKQALSLLSHG